MLLEAKADVNHRTRGVRGRASTALHFAYENNCTEAIELLLKFGADEHIGDLNGESPRRRLDDWKEREEKRKVAAARSAERKKRKALQQQEEVLFGFFCCFFLFFLLLLAAGAL